MDPGLIGCDAGKVVPAIPNLEVVEVNQFVGVLGEFPYESIVFCH
jgi:hypothetical protein